MLEVQGRSDLFLGLEVIKKVIALLPLFIGAVWGILPMLYSNLVIMIIAYFLNSHFSGKLIGYSSWMQIKDVAPSYGVALFVASVVFFLRYLPLSNWIILPIQLVVGFFSFCFICHFSKIEEFGIVKSIITRGLGGKKDE